MRIAIVNDVMMAVEAVRRVVIGSSGHQLAWVALDGEDAVARCSADTPDLILMDLIMPKMGGVEATRQIMASTPCAIVIVTANVDDNSSKVFEAMGAGALDAVNTPVLDSPGATSYPEGPNGAAALLAKIETIRKLIGAAPPNRLSPSPNHSVEDQDGSSGPLVVIGASAGGPAAVAKLLSQLPADFSAPIVVVQHVDSQFSRGLADWLDCQTPLQVRLAQEDDRPSAGVVLLAANDNHMVFESPTRLAYTRHPLESSYRPSVDVFFKSVASFWRGDVIGVILTGMGRDGAEGLRALREKGHHTIAQDRATSAVYGMPKAAADLQAAAEILPLEQIAPRIANLLAQKIKAHG
jgi:two-component system, chemotaxis family, response regulator WspF